MITLSLWQSLLHGQKLNTGIFVMGWTKFAAKNLQLHHILPSIHVIHTSIILDGNVPTCFFTPWGGDASNARLTPLCAVICNSQVKLYISTS